MAFLPSFTDTANILHVFRAYPETARPLIDIHQALLRGPSPFTEAERELLAAYVSGLNRSRYCFLVHSSTAELLGIPQNIIQKSVDDIITSPLSAKMKAILIYAQKLTEAADGNTKADAEALLSAGWNGDALYQTVAITALFNFMSRLVEGLGLTLYQEEIKSAARRFAERGYTSLAEILPQNCENTRDRDPAPRNE